MTPKQERFVQEYLVDLNATQAAIRAGYSKKTAHVIGPELMTKPDVQAAIKAAMDKRSEKTGLTAERVLDEMRAMALWDPAALAVVEKPDPDKEGETKLAFINSPADLLLLPEEVRRAVVGWKWTEHGLNLIFADKAKALDQLARHLSIYNDKLEVKVTEGLAERVRRAKERAASGAIAFKPPVR